MKILSQPLSACQNLLPLEYKIQPFCLERLTEEYARLYFLLEEFEKACPINEWHSNMGRPYFPLYIFRRALFAMSFIGLRCVNDIRKRLLSDSNLRQICGFTKIPSESTFSRKINALLKLDDADKNQELVIKKFLGNKIILHICRDSTAIKSREKAINNKKDVNLDNIKKCGTDFVCPKENDIPRIKRQISQTPEEAISEIPKKCQWGGKTNSQGNKSYWKGYKLHLDVTDFGVPITAVVTGAAVHDSQLAIPMEKITQERVSFLYSLMDKGYDATEIRNFIREQGRIDVIDFKKKRNGEKPVFDEVKSERYKIRTTVERSNSNLKDWLLPDKLCLRKSEAIIYVIKIVVLVLTFQQLLSNGFIKIC